MQKLQISLQISIYKRVRSFQKGHRYQLAGLNKRNPKKELNEKKCIFL